METEEQKKERDLDQIAYLIMKPANISGEKIIDYDELVKFIYDDEADPKEKMREALFQWDADRDGSIFKKELTEFIKFSVPVQPSNCSLQIIPFILLIFKGNKSQPRYMLSVQMYTTRLLTD